MHETRSSRKSTVSKSLIHLYDTSDIKLQVLQPAVDSPADAYVPVRALRKVHYERMKREHFWADKDATLRSGARGWAARKTLIASEKRLAESLARYIR